SVAELAARHVPVEVLGRDLQARGQALEDARQARTVRLAGGCETKRHTPKLIAELSAQPAGARRAQRAERVAKALPDPADAPVRLVLAMETTGSPARAARACRARRRAEGVDAPLDVMLTTCRSYTTGGAPDGRYSSSSLWPCASVIAWHSETLGRHAAMPRRNAPPRSLNFTRRPPALTPTKATNGTPVEGSICLDLRSLYVVSCPLWGGVPGAIVPNRTSTWYTVFGLGGLEGFVAFWLSSSVGLPAGDFPVEEPEEPELLDFAEELGEGTVAALPGSGVKGSCEPPPRCSEAPLVTSASAAREFGGAATAAM